VRATATAIRCELVAAGDRGRGSRTCQAGRPLLGLERIRQLAEHDQLKRAGVAAAEAAL
jgi:hypothetical protein